MAVRITRAGVGLTIGIIILAAVVLGGLYFVKQRGEVARRDDAIQIAEQKLESESTGVLTPATDSSNGTSSEKTKDPDTKPSTTTTKPAGTTGTNGTNVAVNPATQLPQTGPSDAASIIVIGLLSFAGISYFNSRRILVKLR